jgi:hypothetical protein
MRLESCRYGTGAPWLTLWHERGLAACMLVWTKLMWHLSLDSAMVPALRVAGATCPLLWIWMDQGRCAGYENRDNRDAFYECKRFTINGTPEREACKRAAMSALFGIDATIMQLFLQIVQVRTLDSVLWSLFNLFQWKGAICRSACPWHTNHQRY